jgi:hypothetical protein
MKVELPHNLQQTFNLLFNKKEDTKKKLNVSGATGWLLTLYKQIGHVVRHVENSTKNKYF